MKLSPDLAVEAYERGDFAAAISMYEALIKEGHSFYLVPLARMYIDGQGTPIDLSRAEALLDQAIALGTTEGHLQKAALYLKRGDHEKYFRSVQRAADAGLLPGQHLLGLCYARGYGVAIDSRKAMEIMKAAAERGHLGAKLFMGKCLLKNPFRLFDFMRGLILFSFAALKGLYLALRDPHSDLIR